MGIGDPFLYLENDGRRAATVSILDAPKVVELGIEVIDATALGGDELIASGGSPKPPSRPTSRCSSPTTCARTGSS